MKKLWIVFLFLFLLPFFTACNVQMDPEISIEAVVSELSEEEFSHVGTYGLDSPDKNDFRKFSFDFEVVHAQKTRREIEFPPVESWTNAINTIDNRLRYWSGNSYKQDNDSENFARYGHEFVFYSKGLNEQDIRNAFESITLELKLCTAKEESIEKNYKVSDLIEFKNSPDL